MWQAGRSIGILSSIATAGAWLVFVFLNPYGHQGFTAGTYGVAALMLGLALIGIVAALNIRPYVMLAVFAVSFFPVGLYASGTPGPFKWVGAFNCLFLVSAVLMRSSPPQQGSLSK
jgi:hypothetical protein